MIAARASNNQLVEQAGTHRALPVLLYHCIGRSVAGLPRDLGLSYSEFEDQLDLLIDAGWRLTGLDTALEEFAQPNFDNRTLAVTIDDALSGFTEDAIQAVVARSASATLFVPTAYVGAGATWLEGRDLGVLSWAALRDVAAAGIEIGSHGHRHIAMDTTAEPVLLDELVCSRRLIEDSLQAPVRGLAYPFGYARNATRAVAARAGFAWACGIGHRLHVSARNRYDIQRLIVRRDDTAATISSLIMHGGRPVEAALKASAAMPWRCFRHVRSLAGRRP